MNSKERETGVIGGIEKRKIEIVEYQEKWLLKFLEHKNRIQKCLGKLALGIE